MTTDAMPWEESPQINSIQQIERRLQSGSLSIPQALGIAYALGFSGGLKAAMLDSRIVRVGEVSTPEVLS
jgi:hypothetical protein